MTREELIERIARAIAEYEGFYAHRSRPTLAQRNANPGNVRMWRDARGKPYPQYRGYVDFVAWASQRAPGATHEEISRRALEEGWRVLRVLIGHYLDGKYTGGRPPTLYDMFERYAPSSDGNHPRKYAEYVARRIGLRPDRVLSAAVTGHEL